MLPSETEKLRTVAKLKVHFSSNSMKLLCSMKNLTQTNIRMTFSKTVKSNGNCQGLAPENWLFEFQLGLSFVTCVAHDLYFVIFQPHIFNEGGKS